MQQIAASGDITNFYGTTAADVVIIARTIIENSRPSFSADARAIFDERVEDLLSKLALNFKSRTVDPIAFKTPDFQLQLRAAGFAYGRSGDQFTQESLVNLIVERSEHEDLSLIALTLNAAIDKAAVLTKREFNALSLNFLFREHTEEVTSLRELADHITKFAVPLLDDISREPGSCEYLAAQGCGSIGPMYADLYDVLVEKYCHIFFTGISIDDMQTNIPSAILELIMPYVLPCVNDPARVQLSVPNKETLMQKAGLNREQTDIAFSNFNYRWTKPQLIEQLAQIDPRVTELFEIWDATLIRHLGLTAVGKTLAHANLKRLGYEPELDKWIR